MKTGWPPTARNARTGLFTPPGIRRCALSNSCSETRSDMAMLYRVAGVPSRALSRRSTRAGSPSGLRCTACKARLARVAELETLFITGIGGFIGKRLAERALELGFTVHGIDNSPDAVEGAR